MDHGIYQVIKSVVYDLIKLTVAKQTEVLLRLQNLQTKQNRKCMSPLEVGSMSIRTSATLFPFLSTLASATFSSCSQDFTFCNTINWNLDCSEDGKSYICMRIY